MRTRDELRLEQWWFYAWLGVAAVLHVVVVAAFLSMNALDLGMRRPLNVVNVSLVSLPESQTSEQKTDVQPVTSEQVVTPAATPVVKKAADIIPAKPLPAEPASPMADRKNPVSKSSVQQSVPVPMNNTALDERKNLQSVLDNLRKKEAERKENALGEPSDLGSTLATLQKKVAARSSGTTAVDHAGGRGGVVSDLYKARIAGIIQDNWSFSSQLIRSASGMEVYVSIYVLPDGSVPQIRYEQKSASEYLNNSVRAALEKSLPFPPLPRESGSKGVWLGFYFTPAGITK